jgi:hypothetical protein
MSAVDDWQCEYGFVREYWTGGDYRRCLRPWSANVFGTHVCSAHRDWIASRVMRCGECGKYVAEWSGNVAEKLCFPCIDRLWGGATRFNRCAFCRKPVDDRHYHHCGAPICRAVAAYFNRHNRRVGWYHWGELYHLAMLAEFLRRMAQPKDDVAREFAKRYAHRRLK